tara:strand:+ start:327 stop:1433 length:1107 start_codon:yes stop_codon:yes gene_type:complete
MNDVHSLVTQIADKYLGHWKPSGDTDILVNCPFHPIEFGRHTHTLAISTEHGAWLCYSCGASGGLPYLLKKLKVPGSRREMLLEPVKHAVEKQRERARKPRAISYTTSTPLPEVLLGVYQHCPTDLVNAGFAPEVMYDYDVGYDHRHQRITWPVRDNEGNLAGIHGGSAYAKPKYLAYELKHLDPEVRRLVKGYEYKKSYYLWNMDRVWAMAYHDHGVRVNLVEGFKAGLWCIQYGFPNTVAQMGSRLSFRQAEWLKRLGAEVVLFLDNDMAGWRGACAAYTMLTPGCRVRFAMYPEPYYPDDRHPDEGPVTFHQPDDLGPGEVERALVEPVLKTEWLKVPAHKDTWRKVRDEFSSKRRARKAARTSR